MEVLYLCNFYLFLLVKVHLHEETDNAVKWSWIQEKNFPITTVLLLGLGLGIANIFWDRIFWPPYSIYINDSSLNIQTTPHSCVTQYNSAAPQTTT